MTKTITVDASEYKAMQEKIDLLFKVVDKRKLSLHTPKDNVGKDISISTYRKDELDEPKVVLSWKNIKDVVRSTDKGIYENQMMRIFLESDIDESKKGGFKLQVANLNKKLTKLEDDVEANADEIKITVDKIKEYEEKINHIEFVDLNYEEFSKQLEKVVVELSPDDEHYNGVGQLVSYTIRYNGKEFNIAPAFVN